MGLFKMIVPKPEPILAWRTEAGLAGDFEFDFDRHALCGIRPGDPVSLLWKLGPSEDKQVEECFNYYSRGVQAEAENGVVASFILFWNDKEQRKFLAFSGRCIYRGETIGLRAGMTEAEIRGVFGEPGRRDEDEGEVVLFYKFEGIEWEVEIDRREGLTAMVVLTGR